MSEPKQSSDDVFGLLRDLERAAPGRPRIGKALRPSDDIARFGQTPHLDFATTSLELDAGPASDITFIRSLFLSLIGPMGPMPLQISELAIFEKRYAKERPMGDFLDVLANRMIQLFFRAWADSEPVSHQDRVGEDLFQHYVGALGGLVDASPHDEPSRIQLSLLGFAGQTAPRRSAAAIADTASALLGVETSIVEFVGAWRKMEPDDATALGVSGRHNALGQSTMLGLSVYTVQDGCLVRLAFDDLKRFEAHLPDAPGFALANEILLALVPAHLDWRVEFELSRDAVPQAKLGQGAKLGWTSWLGRQDAGPARRDLRLAPRPRFTVAAAASTG